MVTFTCSGFSLAISPVAMRRLPRTKLTSMLPSCVVLLKANSDRSITLSGPTASTVPSFSVSEAALFGPVTMRSVVCTPAPTTAALRALPRTTVTSPCTALKVPSRASPVGCGMAAGAGAGAGAATGAAGCCAQACAARHSDRHASQRGALWISKRMENSVGKITRGLRPLNT